MTHGCVDVREHRGKFRQVVNQVDSVFSNMVPRVADFGDTEVLDVHFLVPAMRTSSTIAVTPCSFTYFPLELILGRCQSKRLAEESVPVSVNVFNLN